MVLTACCLRIQPLVRAQLFKRDSSYLCQAGDACICSAEVATVRIGIC